MKMKMKKMKMKKKKMKKKKNRGFRWNVFTLEAECIITTPTLVVYTSMTR